MWLMMLSGIGMMIAAAVKHYKEKNADKVVQPDLLSKSGKEKSSASQKPTISTIQGEMVPPNID